MPTRLWPRITPEQIDISKIWKASDQLRPLPRWGLKIWWTLVHKQNSYRHACWPTQLDFFGRLYFGPCGCCPLKFIHAIPYHPWVVYPVGLGVPGIFLVWFCFNNWPSTTLKTPVWFDHKQVNMCTTFNKLTINKKYWQSIPELMLILCSFFTLDTVNT